MTRKHYEFIIPTQMGHCRKTVYLSEDVQSIDVADFPEKAIAYRIFTTKEVPITSNTSKIETDVTHWTFITGIEITKDEIPHYLFEDNYCQFILSQMEKLGTNRAVALPDYQDVFPLLSNDVVINQVNAVD